MYNYSRMSAQLDGAPFYGDDSTAMERREVVDEQMADNPQAELMPSSDSSDSLQTGGASNGWAVLSTLIYVALMIASLYLAFRCGKGFNIVQLLLAFCFPLCYIPYGLYACL